MARFGIVILALLWSGIAFSGSQHPACVDYDDWSYGVSTSQELRAIAATCQRDDVARLFYNRAYHADLVDRGDALSELIVQNSRSRPQGMIAYRLYIALIESFAPYWFENPVDRVAFLNTEYDRRTEVVDLRLRGYDHLADTLERKWTPPDQ